MAGYFQISEPSLPISIYHDSLGKANLKFMLLINFYKEAASFFEIGNRSLLCG